MPAECLTSTCFRNLDCLDCLTVRHWLHRLISGKSPIWPEHCSHNLDMVLSPEKLPPKILMLHLSPIKSPPGGVFANPLWTPRWETHRKPWPHIVDYRSSQLAMNKGATYSLMNSVFLQQSPAYLLKLSELTLLIKKDHIFLLKA